jgi:hypothetical protein
MERLIRVKVKIDVKWKSRFFISLVFFLCKNTSFTQNQAANWFFGYQAGLNFMTSPPTPLLSGRTHNWGGSACLSDASGNLIFYTQGDTVWNSSHLIMANGTGLTGYNNAAGSPLIVKNPALSNIYYIFTAGNFTTNVGLITLRLI